MSHDATKPAGAPERQPARYPNVLRLVGETPWAIRAEKLAVIREVLALRAAGVRFTAEEIQARIGDPPQRAHPTGGSVAVIPVYGVLGPRASMFSNISGGGGTGIDQLSDALRNAVGDPAIDAIVLDVDSPGGMVSMVPEFAAEIREARDAKPVVAVANTTAASAAYWLASQADELVVTPSALVGSIGVMSAHEDISGQQERDGVRTTLISAGRHKVEGNPFEPLTDEARAAIQSRIDEFYGMFVDDVAAGRGVTASTVRGGYGEGRVVTAVEAVQLGMADRIDTLEATIERLLVRASSAPGRTQARAVANPAASFAEAASSVCAAVSQLTIDARSLADVRERSRLTAAKRESLSLVADGLRASLLALDELLAETDPTSRPATAGQLVYLETVRSKIR